MENKFHKSGWRSSIVYDIKKLWNLSQSNSCFYTSIHSLTPMLRKTIWSTAEGKPKSNADSGKSISPKNILNNPSESPYHMRKIKNSDLNYPIILVKLDNGKLDIIDGLHRLAKAYSENRKSIKSVFPSDSILEKSANFK